MSDIEKKHKAIPKAKAGDISLGGDTHVERLEMLATIYKTTPSFSSLGIAIEATFDGEHIANDMAVKTKDKKGNEMESMSP